MRLKALAALPLVAACAAQPSPEGDEGPLAFFTAGPGDVMVYSDDCNEVACPVEGQGRWGELVYVGMRAADRAVFAFRREDAAPEAALTPTDAAHLFVPSRPAVEDGEATFIAERPAGAEPDPEVTEIVVDPRAGVVFGADTVEVTIAAASPARVVYTVEPAQ